ncbi:BURP domain-containing protein BNM2A isoform X2 [Ziziphus jujuba]|uniref:BURP domain-containing protein BNM2A isoform X2 n=1 Tax=Ziziphus jujuba TaxID=326968 RepID=A0ABM3IVE9_ZIZJJ|nr:BURP domain-containing protein BNM2A isoform X2 [Ziziphus jujuba]
MMNRMRRISIKGTEMGLALASSSLLFHLLLLMGAHGSESRQSLKFHTQNENNIIQLPSSNIKINNHKKVDDLQLVKFDAKQDGDDHHGTKTEHVHSHGPSSHMDHMDPSVMLFFTMEDLIVGKILPVYFRRTNPSTSTHFLPREEADSIPFSLKELPNLLQFFSFSQNSPQAKAIEDTLRQCEIEPIKGETKLCVTSLESMLDFARSVFGLNSDFNLVTTSYYGNSNITIQNYTILEVPKEILASKMVACHSMPYPYAVFYCHSQKSENKVYKISLGGDNGERVEAVAVCHMDTSQWSPNHASFRVLRIMPGTSPVCHFFPVDNLIWIPAPTA